MENKEHKTDEANKINYPGIKAMPYVIGIKAMPVVINNLLITRLFIITGNETFENLGTTGTSNNLSVYLTTVFNMKNVTAITIINLFNGTTSFATFLGALLSDTYFGRYKTIGFASVASFLGMVMITLTAAIKTLHPPDCGKNTSNCEEPTQWQITFLVSALGFLVVGAGGIRPCNLAFGADQFDPNSESGKRGLSSFFSWYYFTYTFSMMVSLTLIVYIQSEVSWAWGFAIPAFMMFISCLLFFVGTKIYVNIKAQGSPLTTAAQVVMAAIKKRKLKLPDQPWDSLYNCNPTNSIVSRIPYTDQFRFLGKAAIITKQDRIKEDGSSATPWSLCSIQQIEEIKCVLRVIPIWTTNLLLALMIMQQQIYLVFQVLQSDRRVGSTSLRIPAASYGIFTMLSLVIFVPIYDRILVPFLRRMTNKEGGLSLLQKMGTGTVLSILATILSGIVESKRRSLALTNPITTAEYGKGAISSMSGFWLVPPLALAGIADGFGITASNEFYYAQFPENMRSFSGSLGSVSFAAASYLNSVFTTIVRHTTARCSTGNWLPEDLNKGRLDYLYYLVAALGTLNLGYFIICATMYEYKGNVESNSEVAIQAFDTEDFVLEQPLLH